jgi:hypothetical protein
MRAAPWCSGLTCHPVTVEIRGSNPLGVASSIKSVVFLPLYRVTELILVSSKFLELNSGSLSMETNYYKHLEDL